MSTPYWLTIVLYLSIYLFKAAINILINSKKRGRSSFKFLTTCLHFIISQELDLLRFVVYISGIWEVFLQAIIHFLFVLNASGF